MPDLRLSGQALAKEFDGSEQRQRLPGRPPVATEIKQLVVRIVLSNRTLVMFASKARWRMHRLLSGKQFRRDGPGKLGYANDGCLNQRLRLAEITIARD